MTVLRGVFTGWVEVLRAGVDTNMADPDPMLAFTKAKTGAVGLSIIVIGRVSRNTKISYLIPTPQPLVPR